MKNKPLSMKKLGIMIQAYCMQKYHHPEMTDQEYEMAMKEFNHLMEVWKWIWDNKDREL